MDPSSPVSSNGVPPAAVSDAAEATEFPQHHRYTQWVLLACAALSYALFWWVAELLGIPAHRGYEGSLLRQPTMAGEIGSIVVAAGLFIGVTAIITLVARRFWPFIGALAASAGLFSWSFRGGPIRYVLLAPDAVSASTSIFYTLAIELALLGAIVGFTWLVLLPFLLIKRSESKLRVDRPDSSVLQAILAQAVATGLLAMLFIPTGEKKQALFGILFAAFIATAICQHYFADERLAKWYWAGPILVGIVGYILNAFIGDPHLAAETGRLAGTFAPLARPLPLDYASAGVLGAVAGYWIGSEHPGAVEAFFVGGVVHAANVSRRNKARLADEAKGEA